MQVSSSEIPYFQPKSEKGKYELGVNRTGVYSYDEVWVVSITGAGRDACDEVDRMSNNEKD